MEIGTVAGKAVVDLIKNENVQNKTISALGMLFPYAGIKKRAIDTYINDIENSNLPSETKVVAMLNAKKTIKKLKNQKDIADIAIENSKAGTDFSDKSGVNQEWIERFMESAGFVSSDEMKLVWGKILSNEFEQPGSTPPNMIRILSEITPTLARAFKKICSMKVWICPLLEDENIEMAFQKIFVPYKGHDNELRELGISFNILNELETLGVIKVSTISGYASKNIDNANILLCIGDKLEVISEHKNGELPIGNVILTSAGESLQQITEAEEIPNYYNMIRQYLLEKGVKIADDHNFQATEDGDTLNISKKNS